MITYFETKKGSGRLYLKTRKGRGLYAEEMYEQEHTHRHTPNTHKRTSDRTDSHMLCNLFLG